MQSAKITATTKPQTNSNPATHLCMYMSHICTSFLISVFMLPFLLLCYLGLWLNYLALSKSVYFSTEKEFKNSPSRLVTLAKICLFRPSEAINAHGDILIKSTNFINSIKLVLVSVISSKELIINIMNYFVKPLMEEFEYKLNNNSIYVFIPLKQTKAQTMILFVNNKNCSNLNNEQKFKKAHMPLVNSLIKEGYSVVLPVLNNTGVSTSYIHIISEIEHIIDFVGTNATLIGVSEKDLYLMAYHDMCLLVTIATIKRGIRTHKSTIKGLILFEGLYEIHTLYKAYATKNLKSYCRYLRKMTELMPLNKRPRTSSSIETDREMFKTMEKWSIPKILKNLKLNVSNTLINKCLPKQFLLINSKENADGLHAQAQKVFKVMDELNMDVEFKLYSNMPQINPLIYMCCSSVVGVSKFIISDINEFVEGLQYQ